MPQLNSKKNQTPEPMQRSMRKHRSLASIIKPVSHSQRLMDVQKSKLVDENKEILSRLVAAKPSITPFSKL